MNKLTVALLLIVALGVGAIGGFYFERSRATIKIDEVKMAMQKQIDEGKMMLQKQQVTQPQESAVMMAKAGYATDTKGMTLYTFDKDTTFVSTCYTTCAKTWPPYLVSGVAQATLPDHLGTTKRTDGTTQYTWNNHPLYYYIGDKKAGDTTGDGIGSVWHVAK